MLGYIAYLVTVTFLTVNLQNPLQYFLERRMKKARRKFVGFSLATWTAPVITVVSLPTHAQTSVCDDVDEVVMPPTGLGPVEVGDNAGLAPIDNINIPELSLCRRDEFECDSFEAFGLPAGLTLSSDGIISGTYNAVGNEFFTIDISTVYCGQVRPIGFLQLTIVDEG